MPRNYEHYDSRYTADNTSGDKEQHLRAIAQRRLWLKAKCKEIKQQPLDPHRYDYNA
jgi:hypothetical protein